MGGRYRLFYFKSILFIVFIALFSLHGISPVDAAEKEFHHLVILGDPHLPGKYIENKEQVISTINTWQDVDMVIAVGDICEDRGTDEEYAEAKRFFLKLKKPFYPIVGNHDFIYDNNFDSKGKRNKAGPETREAKLKKFRDTFGLQNNSYSKSAGTYHLIFLSLDSSGHLAEISQKQIAWLRSELDTNKNKPTIIFFHAPLDGTLQNYNKNANAINFIAQPSDTIKDMLMANPQVFLWVSGHTHTSPKEESFASAINVYKKRIANIHNTDMNREKIWTNSLFLYPDKVDVKTYNHKSKKWESEFERTIALPAL
jgi:predicted MPP superfamily phosphohydrolase